MELIIGREATSSKLSVKIDNQEKVIGQSGSVPKTVSRQHCQVVLNPDESYTITNLSPSNITCVNGVQVVSKSINPNKDIVTLGSGGYILDLRAIVNYFKSNAAKTPAPVKTVSISHLQAIWDANHDTKLNIQIKEKKSAAIKSITGVFSMSSVACGFIPGIADIVALRIILYATGFILMVYFFVMTYKSSSNMPKFMDALDRKFHEDYVCPNTDCHHFLGYQPYNDLKKKANCPYCKAKFTSN